MIITTNDDDDIEIPTGAFAGTLQLGRTVTLETAFDNPHVVDHSDLLRAWEALSASSVEAAIVGRPGLFDFANNHCMMFAAIRAPARVHFPVPVDISSLPLPKHTKVSWTDAPIVPQNPIEFQKILDALDEPYDDISTSVVSANSLEGCPSNSPGMAATSQPHTGPTSSTNKSNDDEEGAEEVVPEGPTTPAVFVAKTIGAIYVSMSPIPSEVYVGLTILPEYCGHGAGLRAAAAAVQWAIDVIGAHRVQARVLASSPSAPSARRLFAALGFAHEGVQRSVIPDATGDWTDVAQMGIVDTQWVVRRRVGAVPRGLWDELLCRHQREREELLKWEASQARLKRTSSMETVRGEAEMQLTETEESCSESEAGSSSVGGTRSSSPASVVSRYHPASLEDSRERDGRQVVDLREDDFEDSDWVALSNSSGEEGPVSRSSSVASWSSFETRLESASASSTRSDE